jgi:hypothetical protein
MGMIVSGIMRKGILLIPMTTIPLTQSAFRLGYALSAGSILAGFIFPLSVSSLNSCLRFLLLFHPA